ncbi:MAG: ATP-binding protein [Planctomycetota bacterium]|jgi:hypothetical protein|nr:ATP-binding protein [Planctomycetota bacterium]
MEPVIPKYFNIAGPCIPGEHYMLPAVDRLPEARKLVERKQYFVIHAARQSGKTTILRALTREINAEGQHYALYCSLEALQEVREAEKGSASLLSVLKLALKRSFVQKLREQQPESPDSNPSVAVGMSLMNLCLALDKPLILFLDEADCLSGQLLITFLRQLRDGYVNRDAAPFPWSIALVGMRDIRDFKARVRPDSETLGSASPFNIITEALTLGNFTSEQVAALYRQHTEATGQIFEPGAVERAWYWSEGQPWLVNALARQVVEKDLKQDYSLPVTAGHIDGAADALMKRRDTHIDSLLERLKESRVRRVIEPMLSGAENEVSLLHDDTKFCLDLGLVRADAAGMLKPANPIYREVIIRALTYDVQALLPASLINRWMDGKRLDLTALLAAFQQFWRENADIYLRKGGYLEAVPHLVLQAFLQRVVNGGAELAREFALGRGAADVSVRYAGRSYLLELKLAGREPLERSLAQTAGYMDVAGAREAWLVIFDRDAGKTWEEKIFRRDETLPDGRTVHVVGC